MAQSKYVTPDTVHGACSLLEEYGEEAAILSGGQSLMPARRQGATSCDIVVDINDIEEADYVDVSDEKLRLGCLVRHADVVQSSEIRAATPTLADTAEKIGDVQVRNRGTFCGAVAQAEPKGDPPVLAALFDADITAVSTDGETVYNGSSFYHGSYKTELDEDELISEISFPVMGDDEGAGYEKWKPGEVIYPVASVGAYVSLDGNTVSEGQLYTGAIEGGPTEMSAAASVLEGAEPDEDTITAAAQQLGDDAMPLDDFEGSPQFKKDITKSLAKSALETAVERAQD